jgi:hypothetical protein
MIAGRYYQRAASIAAAIVERTIHAVLCAGTLFASYPAK